MKNSSPLTQEQSRFLQENGYLIIEDVLVKKEIHTLLQTANTIIKNHEKDKVDDKNTRKNHGVDYYNIHNPLEYSEVFDFLIDHFISFDIIRYLMGPYIQLNGCHIFVRRPTSNNLGNIGKFHTDSGPALQRILPLPGNLPLQLKVQFFLTDVLTENQSNFWAVPGSHLRQVGYHHPFCFIPQYNAYLERGDLPPDAIQVKLKAGDILFHHLNLWHAVAPNFSNQTRISISLRYAQMWFKEYYSYYSSAIIDRMTPRRRRLLGDFGEYKSGDIAYRPPIDQVPLILGDKAELYGWSMKWLEDR